MTRKEEGAYRMKERICEALLHCLSMESFQKITVKKIIEKAGINRSTFYKYFLDKYDLRDYYLGQILEEFKQEKNYDFIKAGKDEIDNPVYSRNLRNSEEFIKKNSRTYKILWSSDIGSDLYRQMQEILRADILETILTDPFYSEEKLPYAILYADLFSCDFMLTIRWWIDHMDTIEFEYASNLMKGNMEKGFFQTFRDIMEGKIKVKI